MAQQITHTTKTYGGEMPSIGGVGGYKAVDTTTRVKWTDAGETTLVVAGTTASVWHKGKNYQLKPVSGNHDAVVSYWMTRIQKRLEAKRLADRVRCWNTDKTRLSAA